MTGDGIMALFGAPIALEDASQRAIRSAFANHREMTRFNDKMKQEKEGIPPFKMRIGIHTGPVVVGTLGNDLWSIAIVKSCIAMNVYNPQGKIDLGYRLSREAIEIAEESGDAFSKEDKNKVKLMEGQMARAIGEILLNIDDQHMNEAEDWIKKAIKTDYENELSALS
jgi:hypothetical protein